MTPAERLEQIRLRLKPFLEDHHAATMPAKYADWLADCAWLLSALDAAEQRAERLKVGLTREMDSRSELQTELATERARAERAESYLAASSLAKELSDLRARCERMREETLEEAAKEVESLEGSPAAIAIANGMRAKNVFKGAARTIRALKAPAPSEAPNGVLVGWAMCSRCSRPYRMWSSKGRVCEHCGYSPVEIVPCAAPLKGDEE